ncbi:MAG: flagellar biosynthesis protein FlhF [Rhodocyclaceae bacterium]|jgi:flagellar biosynthesis protein FlhF|nr:flagellar biosynthesis protein FlhF [Rhodocyclaceae bacterium]
MTVKRFFGESAREALRKVKAALGPEAIVISNKPVPGGVEIMAMSADSLEALQGGGAAPAALASAPQAQPAPVSALAQKAAVPPAPTFAEDESDYAVSLSAKARAPSPFQPWQPPRTEAAPAAVPAARTEERVRPRPLPPKTSPVVAPREQAPVAAALEQAGQEIGLAGMSGGFDSSAQVRQLMTEMQSIKGLLERQLAGFAWSDMTRHAPAKAQLLGEMLEAGFSGLLARRLVEDMPEDLDMQAGRKWLTGAVNRRLRTLTSENDLIERGGVFALVGPTGVGKTTTTAKLAARCVVRYGADKLALLTTDGYRIGAHEQLRIYGRILGVPVHVVRDGEDLRRTLADLRGKHMVLIDTVGMSQRDRMVAEQAAMLMRAGEVRRLLLLNATSRGDTLDDVIRNYAGEDLAGCILSKVDETASLAPALDAVVRNGLLLAYVANGQRVPEDLHLPNRSYLLHRAFKQPAETSVHRLKEEEVGLVMPAASAARGAVPV